MGLSLCNQVDALRGALHKTEALRAPYGRVGPARTLFETLGNRKLKENVNAHSNCRVYR